MSTSAGYQKPAGAAEDFFRSGNVTTKPDGTTDVTDAIVHQGRAGVGPFSADPIAQLDVATAGRSGPSTVSAATPLYVTGALPTILNGVTPAASVEFRHSNQTQGVGIAYDGVYATGSIADQHLTLMQRGAGVMRKIWQAVNLAINDYWNQAALAVGQGVQHRVIHGPGLGTVVANHYVSFTESTAPLNVRQQFDITTNGGLAAALRIQPDVAAPGNTTLYVGEQRVHNRKIVLFEGGATDTDRFFGFGINASTLRYQISSVVNFNRWYAWTTTNTSQMIFSVSGVGNVTVDPTGINPGGYASPLLRFGGEGSSEFIASKRTATGNQNGLDFGTNGAVAMSIGQSRNVRFNHHGQTADGNTALGNPRVLIDDAGTSGGEQQPLLMLRVENCGGPCGQLIPPALVITNNNGTSGQLGRIAWASPPTINTDVASIEANNGGNLTLAASALLDAVGVDARLRSTTGTAALNTAGVNRLTAKNNGIINLQNVPTFATDALAGAGGLVSGDVYKSAAGVLSVKL